MMEGYEEERVYFDSHMHTPLCKHAYGHPREYAAAGKDRGLKGIIFTCHSPMPNRFSENVRMEPSEFDDYVSLVESTAREFEGDFTVRLGMESDWFPGMEKWVEELHRRAEFHYIIGSVHYHTEEYFARFFDGDVHRFMEGYFGHIAESAECGLFDGLGHADLVKNVSPEHWDFERLEGSIDEALTRVAATGVAMELNTSGLNKAYPEVNPGPRILRMMFEKGIPVVLGSDAHTPDRVGADFEFGLDLIAAAGYERVHYFERREPVAIRIEDVKRSVRETTMSSVSLST
ncbi:MAG: histidinol-phosphatase [Verrucomicrobiota bacterium]